MRAPDAFAFLGSRYARALTLVLAAQAAVFYGASRGERVPLARPLIEFPQEVQGWQSVQESPIDKEIRDILKADDILSRVYASPARSSIASLFVAFFKSQRAGQAPHSPRNCLPGSGWEPTETGYLDVPVSGRPEPIRINRYVVARGEEKSVVLYWYQSRDRVIASEYSAKFWAVADSIRYHRSDTALVRVVVPFSGANTEAATRTGVEFVERVFPALRQYLPS